MRIMGILFFRYSKELKSLLESNEFRNEAYARGGGLA